MGELKPVISTEELNGGFRWVSAEDDYAKDRELMTHYNLLMEARSVLEEYGPHDSDEIFEALALIGRKIVARYLDRLEAPEPIKELLADDTLCGVFDELFKLALEETMESGRVQ
ncbi:hypothetical protein [Pontibacillus salipaludis]|uniref:hypothetical protein n=1 Tax=Pontibacillus salipaludis TaxID=1697394 RepID=UPI0031E96879